MARTGRRPGGPRTREQILRAARGRFAADGFRGATVRAIAADAEVDPALIHHYFGTKRELFGAVLEFPVSPERVSEALADVPVEAMGETIVATFLGIWDVPEHADRLRILLRSAISDAATRDLLQQFVLDALLQPVAARIDAGDARDRVVIAASQLIGVALLRHVLEVEPLASAPVGELVATYGPTIQRYLTGDVAV